MTDTHYTPEEQYIIDEYYKWHEKVEARLPQKYKNLRKEYKRVVGLANYRKRKVTREENLKHLAKARKLYMQQKKSWHKLQ